MLPQSDFGNLLANLPEYEQKLLLALAFFLGRDADAQAKACLCMYLRQSEPRIMAQLKYYAHKATRQGSRLSEYDLLDLIAEAPERVHELLGEVGQVHAAHQADVFDRE